MLYPTKGPSATIKSLSTKLFTSHSAQICVVSINIISAKVTLKKNENSKKLYLCIYMSMVKSIIFIFKKLNLCICKIIFAYYISGAYSCALVI